MTTYYVSKKSTSADANNGTSAATAWATIAKALGASGMASGDTVYIGPGIYRETVAVGFTPSGATNVIGDVDGSHVVMAPGEVRITAYINSELLGASTGFNNNTKPFMVYSNIVFQTSSNNNPVSLVTHDCSFTDCAFVSGTSGASVNNNVMVVDTNNNIIYERCDFVTNGAAGLSFTLPTSTTADYDAGVYIRNCRFISLGGTTGGVLVSASGANTFKGGGVHVRNCTFLGCIVQASGANVSTTFPVTVYNSFFWNSTTALNATTLGQIVEDYNYGVVATARSNVTQGLHSSLSPTGPSPLIHFGQERFWGGTPRLFGTPVADSPALAWGDAAASGSDTQPTIDILQRPNMAGATRVTSSGTATAGAATTLTDSGANFGANTILGAVVKITGGTGSGQVKMIKTHTNTVLTMWGNWQTTPDATSTYIIYFGAPAESFTCTSGSTTTAVQSSAAWSTNLWAGFAFTVTAGTGNGQTGTVTSNTGTTLTVPTLGTALDSTSKVTLYRKTNENTNTRGVGAQMRHDTASKEVTLTDAGSVAFRLYGWADQTVQIPVDTTSTTITVKCSFDTDHGTTNKPQLLLIADGETGVAAQTITATGSAGSGTFETLSLAAFTATTAGVVTIRLVSRADKPTGRAVFDTISVT